MCFCCLVRNECSACFGGTFMDDWRLICFADHHVLTLFLMLHRQCKEEGRCFEGAAASAAWWRMSCMFQEDWWWLHGRLAFCIAAHDVLTFFLIMALQRRRKVFPKCCCFCCLVTGGGCSAKVRWCCCFCCGLEDALNVLGGLVGASFMTGVLL